MSENIFQQFFCIAKDVSTYSHGNSYYTRLISYKIDGVILSFNNAYDIHMVIISFKDKIEKYVRRISLENSTFINVTTFPLF